MIQATTVEMIKALRVEILTDGLPVAEGTSRLITLLIRTVGACRPHPLHAVVLDAEIKMCLPNFFRSTLTSFLTFLEERN